ncbi:hypothetical protein RFI_30379, partial [Reticulomyxa filosa]
TCLGCTGKIFNGEGKNWYDMSRASEAEVSLDDFLDYYDDSGTVVTINGQTFSNVIPKSRLKDAQDYERVGTNWGCGNNAINICLKMYDYSKQLSTSEYEYNKLLGCGWSYTNFYEKNIKPHFKYCGWKGTETLLRGEVNINWSYIDGTDFKDWSLIILGGNDICAHYTIVLGEDKHV